MKLFVAFHYHNDDKWIKDLVFPILESLEIKVITGENIHGDIIVAEVPELIKKSNCMIAFITKSWHEHPWVRDELITAVANNIPALEIKDASLPNVGGIVDGRQRLEFDIDKKEEFLVHLVKVLCRWKKNYETRSLMILPNEIIDQARPHLRTGVIKCTYQFKDGNEESKEYKTPVFRLPQGLGIDIKNIPSNNALIQLRLEGPGFSWSCGYESFIYIPIKLQNDL